MLSRRPQQHLLHSCPGMSLIENCDCVVFCSTSPHLQKSQFQSHFKSFKKKYAFKHLGKLWKCFHLWIISLFVILPLPWTFIQVGEMLIQEQWKHGLLPIPTTLRHLHFLFLNTFVSIQPILCSWYCKNRSHCNCTDRWVSNLKPLWVYECHSGTTLKHNMLWDYKGVTNQRKRSCQGFSEFNKRPKQQIISGVWRWLNTRIMTLINLTNMSVRRMVVLAVSN